MHYDPIYLLLIGGIFLASMYVSNTLRRKFAYYSKFPLANNLSGKEIAEKMLSDNGIHDVKIVSVPGQLVDHYNPITKTVNLSDVVYNERNQAAAAVAAHECGHALQHAQGYAWLRMRSGMVPALNISSKLLRWVLIGGIVLFAASGNPFLLWIGIGLFALTTIFAFVTLPVEYDASNRALVWMRQSGVVDAKEVSGAKDALKWAARTYVVAALGSLGQLLYYIMIATQRR